MDVNVENAMGGKWMESQSLIWTTRDEVNYLQSLADAGNLKLLLNYYRFFHYRRFEGNGMQVNRREVAKALRVILYRKATIKQLADHRPRGAKEDGQAIVRAAAEWLGGGNLRALAQRREGDDATD